MMKREFESMCMRENESISKVRRCGISNGKRDQSSLLTDLACFSVLDVSEDRLDSLRSRLDLFPYEERAAFAGLLSWIAVANEWYSELLCRTRESEAMVVALEEKLALLSNPV